MACTLSGSTRFRTPPHTLSGRSVYPRVNLSYSRQDAFGLPEPALLQRRAGPTHRFHGCCTSCDRAHAQCALPLAQPRDVHCVVFVPHLRIRDVYVLCLPDTRDAVDVPCMTVRCHRLRPLIFRCKRRIPPCGVRP